MTLTLLSCGSNAQGQLAHDTTEDSHNFESCIFSEPISLVRILQLATGGNHTLLLADVETSTKQSRTQLYSCGDGTAGQLGGGESSSQVFQPIDLQLDHDMLENFQPRLICASWQTSYLVLSCPEQPDRLISMGSNDFGDLGIGGGRVTAKVHTVRFNHLVVDGLSVDDDSYLDIKSIAAGQHHVVVHLHVRLSDGSYRYLTAGWGVCRHGELGSVEEVPSNNGKRSKPPSFVPSPRLILIDEKFDSLALGNQHTVLRCEDGRIFAFGSNKRNQLSGLTDIRGSEIGCTWNGTYVVCEDRRIYATGSHNKGQLGRSSHNDADSITIAPVEFPSTTLEVTSMACGSEHILALFRDNGGNTEVWGWGWNEHGNLGIGSTEDVHLPAKIWFRDGVVDGILHPLVGNKVVGIWAGCGTSWVAVEH